MLYGSESELDDSDNDDPMGSTKPSTVKTKGGRGGARLRMDGDNPIDLLQGAASRLTSAYILDPSSLPSSPYFQPQIPAELASRDRMRLDSRRMTIQEK